MTPRLSIAERPVEPGRTMAKRASSPHASSRARRRRLAAEHRAHAARVLVCECRNDGDSPVAAEVRSMGYEAVACASAADALREAARTPFDVVIAAMPAVDGEHVSLLQLLRRGNPATPLVVVSGDQSLEARARIQPVRPYYYAVLPLPQNELRAILSGAVEAASRAS